MSKITQAAFNAGILAEGMRARVDTEKFQKGLSDAVNVTLRPQGGASNRAGTEAVTRFDAEDAERQRLVRFQFNTKQTYVLEFATGVFRVISDGAYVLDTNVGELAISGITAADPAQITLTNAADAAELTVGDLLYVEDTDGTHSLHTAIVQVTGLSGAAVSFRAFDKQTLDTSSGWGLTGAGATVQKVYSKSHTLSNFQLMRTAQDADTLYIAHPEHPPSKIGRLANDNWTFENVAFGPKIAAPATASVTITGATQANPAVITAPAHGLAVGDAFSINGVVGMTQLNEKVYTVAAATTDTITLSDRAGAAVDSSGYTTYSSGGTAVSPGVSRRLGPDVDLSNMLTYEYAVAAVDAETSEESVITEAPKIDNDLFYQGSENYIGWRAVPGATRYAVYRKSAGSYAYVGSTTGTTFDDANITPDEATGPQLGRNPFGSVGNYPSIAAFYEQRLVWGATLNDPQLVEMSRVSAPENFNAAFPSLPDDAFRFRLRDTQLNAISAFVPSMNFVMLTSGGEWEIAAQGDGEYVRPDRRRLSPVTFYGAAALEPLYTGTVVLFVEPSGGVVREYRPGDSTPPQDLTVLSGDLFEDREIVSWAYAQAPHKIVWTVLDDGSLVTMTYMPEHDVWGWTKQQLGGASVRVRQVTVVRESARDVPYFVVTREIGGRDVTMVERLTKREDRTVEKCHYLDGGARYVFGQPAGQVEGLLHLRGQTVKALVDGDVVDGLTVSAQGEVDFGGAEGRSISIGLPYDSYIETLDVRVDSRDLGSSEGRFKSTSEAAVKLQRSRGVEAGMSLDRMSALKEWTPAMVGGPIPLSTHTPNMQIDGDWVRDATIFVRQPHPLPMTVLSITPDWEFGE